MSIELDRRLSAGAWSHLLDLVNGSSESAHALADKISGATNAFQFLCGRQPDRIFVCQTMDPMTGERAYGSVWGFADANAMEARSLKGGWDVDISPYVNGVQYVGIEYVDIDLMTGGVSDLSRLAVELKTSNVAYSNLSAVGLGCNELLAIVRELFLPNLTWRSRK